MSAIDDLKSTMARLRGPGGCPWDREQDHRSIAYCLIEECAELLDTIDRQDMEHMREELGDVLLQVVFHSRMAEEAGHFDFEAVAAEINEKLVRRHPHVFGDTDLKDSAAVLAQWDKIKAGEKKAGAPRPEKGSLFKERPRSLPALLYAANVVKEMDKQGVSWPAEPAVQGERIDALGADLGEETAGARLFELAAACRRRGIDPESALRRYAGRVVNGVDAEAVSSP